MGINFNKYKEKYHFSVNFYSIFLILTALPDILHVKNTIVTLPYWGIKILLACWVISKNKIFKQPFSRAEILFLILSFIYAVKIFVDIFVFPLRALGPDHGSMDFIGFCIGILLALSFRYDPAYHSEASLKFFILSLAAGLVIAYFTAIPSVIYDEAGLRLDANTTINTITYGISGCALCLVSVFGFTEYKKTAIRLALILTFIIGFISIAKAGARSPVVVLALVSIFFLMARMGSLKGFVILFVMVAFVLIFLNPITELLQSLGSGLADRLTKMIVQRDTSGRDVIYKNVINIIESSPITGAFYLVPSGPGVGMYPHNYLLEVFMATGLIGGIPFIILLFISMRKAFKLIKMRHPSTWIVILYVQIIFYGMFSTGLYTTEDFWILAFYIASLKIPSNTLESPVAVRSSKEVASVF